MKYETIAAFKNLVNVPNCKAVKDMRVGMGAVLDRKAGTVDLPDGDPAAKKIVYIVSNIGDKPEIHDSKDLGKVAQGEYVRLDDLRTVSGLGIEFGDPEITGGAAAISVGDTLVFGADGKIKKEPGDTAAYAVVFKVFQKTTYMGNGVIAEIVAQ